jgi:uncharacterized protein with FMN-binding domain
MRRITTWLLGTISALVLLFSYHTSTDATPATSVVAQGDDGTASDGTTDSGSSDSGSASDSGSSGSGSSGDSGSSGSGSSGDAGSSGSGASSGSSGGSSSSSGSSGGSSSSSSSSSKTYTGDAVSTRYGDVQVRIRVKNGKVTSAKVTQVPWGNGRDQQINSYAVPVLNQEAVASQSASIDMVSGATYTSQGYIGSLQSALDQAHL